MHITFHRLLALNLAVFLSFCPAAPGFSCSPSTMVRYGIQTPDLQFDTQAFALRAAWIHNFVRASYIQARKILNVLSLRTSSVYASRVRAPNSDFHARYSLNLFAASSFGQAMSGNVRWAAMMSDLPSSRRSRPSKIKEPNPQDLLSVQHGVKQYERLRLSAIRLLKSYAVGPTQAKRSTYLKTLDAMTELSQKFQKPIARLAQSGEATDEIKGLLRAGQDEIPVSHEEDLRRTERLIVDHYWPPPTDYEEISRRETFIRELSLGPQAMNVRSIGTFLLQTIDEERSSGDMSPIFLEGIEEDFWLLRLTNLAKIDGVMANRPTLSRARYRHWRIFIHSDEESLRNLSTYAHEVFEALIAEQSPELHEKEKSASGTWDWISNAAANLVRALLEGVSYADHTIVLKKEQAWFDTIGFAAGYLAPLLKPSTEMSDWLESFEKVVNNVPDTNPDWTSQNMLYLTGAALAGRAWRLAEWAAETSNRTGDRDWIYREATEPIRHLFIEGPTSVMRAFQIIHESFAHLFPASENHSNPIGGGRSEATSA